MMMIYLTFQVKNTPLYSLFLNVLLCINQIDNSQACRLVSLIIRLILRFSYPLNDCKHNTIFLCTFSEEIWSTIEKFVQQKVTQRDGREANGSGDSPDTPESRNIPSPAPSSPSPPPPLPPPPPPVPSPTSNVPQFPGAFEQGTAITRLRPIATPEPKCKMKHVWWSIISSYALIGKEKN